MNPPVTSELPSFSRLACSRIHTSRTYPRTRSRVGSQVVSCHSLLAPNLGRNICILKPSSDWHTFGLGVSGSSTVCGTTGNNIWGGVSVDSRACFCHRVLFLGGGESPKFARRKRRGKSISCACRHRFGREKNMAPRSAEGIFRVEGTFSPATSCRCSPFSSVTRAAEGETEPTLPQSVIVHYNRNDDEYKGWGLHVWGDVANHTSWDAPLPPAGRDEFGIFWEVQIDEALDGAEGDRSFNFLVHRGDEKDCEWRFDFRPKSDKARKIGEEEEEEGKGTSSFAGQVWVVSKRNETFLELPDIAALPSGNLEMSKAFWVSERVLATAWTPQGSNFFLHSSPRGNLSISPHGVEGSDVVVPLELLPGGLPLSVKTKFPHLADLNALSVPPDADVASLVKCQLALSCEDESGAPLDATSVQLPGVLDDMFSYDGPLGVHFAREEIREEMRDGLGKEGGSCVGRIRGVDLFLWAPTAQSVHLLLFSSPHGDSSECDDRILMTEGKRGCWSVHGPKEWVGKFYLFEVVVFHPSTNRLETSFSTDPYSRGLSANGERSLIVDLLDSALLPEGWARLGQEKPALANFCDSSIYELHIRDFSAADHSVPEEFRGTFLAFTVQDSEGMQHLRGLAEAGLSHVHLLPSYDFGSVDEVKQRWKSVDEDELALLPPDSEEQQRAVTAIQNEDAFNWGYDPVHFGVPDGSYSTDPDGTLRTLEYRSMVQALNRAGLRVVVDVVYNHLYGSGPSSRLSVLDKIVPGYYLRRNGEGGVESSTCMNNTASEHCMMNRLIVDDLLHWASTYKVDGFRFDLMGHIMKRTIMKARGALNKLTRERDGVDGKSILMYGEGWDFGEIAQNQRGENASQLNLGGSGIGSFNDRIRDRAIGGSPFANPLLQGFVTGLLLQPNEWEREEEGGGSVHRLLHDTDWIKLALAGNLRDFQIISAAGRTVKGEDVLTHDGTPVAYALCPSETINYVSAHDNETLFDVITIKAASEVSAEQRIRMNSLATSIIALSQGVPFFHAGDEMLRSKSLDRDSYNSGDWFNKLDFSYTSNNFGVGLPPKEKNGDKWPMMRPLLANAALRPSPADISACVSSFQTLLKIRYSSPLFRLRSAPLIQKHLRFFNEGPNSVLGVVAMVLGEHPSIEESDVSDAEDTTESIIDPLYKQIVVVINARPDECSVGSPSFAGTRFLLHPLQEGGHDEVVKQSTHIPDIGFFKVPARTTAVFVNKR